LVGFFVLIAIVAEALHGLARFEQSVAPLRYAERHGRWSPEGV
jgi:hypothetical protein